MKKRVICFILAIFMLASLGTMAFAAQLSDLSTKNWYYNEVQAMVDAGYITGYPDGTFQGEKSVTLAEFVTIIARMLNLPTGKDGHWAGVQMNHAISSGWLDSYDLSLVGYDEPITRQLAAKLIVASTELADSHTPAHHLSYNDFDSIDPAYHHWVQEAYYYGLFIGSTDGGFHPNDPLIRGAAATVIYRSVLNVRDVYDIYSTEEIIDYFVEVAMSAEYDTNGNPDGSTRPVVKWNGPIYTGYSGNYTPEDIFLLDTLMEEINGINGFPGFYKAQNYDSAAFRMRFAMAGEMDYVQGYYNPGFDGYFTVWWWNSSMSIYDAQIYYRAENLEQYYRNPTLCEELLQALGIMNDSYRYPDSLFYQPYNTVQWPADIDWLILELLYNPAIRAGMSEYECRAVLADILANK